MSDGELTFKVLVSELDAIPVAVSDGSGNNWVYDIATYGNEATLTTTRVLIVPDTTPSADDVRRDGTEIRPVTTANQVQGQNINEGTDLTTVFVTCDPIAPLTGAVLPRGSVVSKRGTDNAAAWIDYLVADFTQVDPAATVTAHLKTAADITEGDTVLVDSCWFTVGVVDTGAKTAVLTNLDRAGAIFTVFAA